MKSKIFKRSVWAIVTLFFAILMGIFIVLQDAVVPYERWIDNFFGVRRTFLVNDEGEEEKTRNITSQNIRSIWKGTKRCRRRRWR